MQFEQPFLKKQTLMPTDTLRYVCVFHLFNYDWLVMNHTLEACNILSECETSLATILKRHVIVKEQNIQIGKHVQAHFFSNTITLLTNGNTATDCAAIVSCAADLMGECIRKQILVSAYIHNGQFHLNEQTQSIVGKPYIKAKIMAEKTHFSCILCDRLVEQNIKDFRQFNKDDLLLKKMGECLLINWEVSYVECEFFGKEYEEQWVVDWPRYNLDVFEQIKDYSLDDFYNPFAPIYGPFDSLSNQQQRQFRLSLSFLNHCLKECVKRTNSTL